MKSLFLFNLVFLQGILYSSHIEKDLSFYGFRKISHSPEIYECLHFLTDTECDSIIEKAKPNLERSRVIDQHSSKQLIDTRRISLGTFLPKMNEGRVIEKVRSIVEKITNIPSRNGEGIQVLHYLVGGEYQPHFDWFDPKTTGGLVHYNRGGQRVATLLVYLNTVKEGGETVFPKAQIKIAAIKGKAVLFYNIDLEGRPDRMSLHGGAPVIAGEKWIATLWLREEEFQ